MSSKEDQIIDGTVVKETTSEDDSLRLGMENLRLRDDDHHTRGSQSTRFEDGHFQMIDLQVPTRQGHRGYRRKFHAMATKTDNSPEDLQKRNKTSSERTCPVCGERHDIEDCKYYLQQTLEERSKLVFQKKLCYGCLEPMTMEHNAKDCKHRLTCKICRISHPAGLYRYTKKVRSDTST